MIDTKLSKSEAEALNEIYLFSKKRGFRYGINEMYIRNKSHVNKLFEKKLVFFKKWKGHIYWLPTFKGRSIVESNKMLNEGE